MNARKVSIQKQRILKTNKYQGKKKKKVLKQMEKKEASHISLI